LFTGVDNWQYCYYGSLAGNTGQPPQPIGYPHLWDNTKTTVNPERFDVTVEIYNGVVTTTVTALNMTGVAVTQHSYPITALDAEQWNGQMKFVTFRGGPGSNCNFSRAAISNVAFYKNTTQTRAK
jgi:hypothetical protein